MISTLINNGNNCLCFLSHILSLSALLCRIPPKDHKMVNCMGKKKVCHTKWYRLLWLLSKLCFCVLYRQNSFVWTLKIIEIKHIPLSWVRSHLCDICTIANRHCSAIILVQRFGITALHQGRILKTFRIYCFIRASYDYVKAKNGSLMKTRASKQISVKHCMLALNAWSDL